MPITDETIVRLVGGWHGCAGNATGEKRCVCAVESRANTFRGDDVARVEYKSMCRGRRRGWREKVEIRTVDVRAGLARCRISKVGRDWWQSLRPDAPCSCEAGGRDGPGLAVNQSLCSNVDS